MPSNPIIIFVCEHGAAKSILAAAYFNKMARENNLSLTVIARGMDPNQEFSPNVITELHEDGLTPTDAAPQKLSREDVQSAQGIISFCELPEEYQQKTIIEQWNSIPPVSENYEKARDAIIERLNQLINHIQNDTKRSFP